MPTSKDFKRLVRARMQKTGEAYTTARAQLLSRKQASAPAPAPAPALPQYAKLAGTSDATLKAKTGCTWERWVKALDHVEAHTWPHRQIAAYVHEKYKVPGWWAQTVTVGRLYAQGGTGSFGGNAAPYSFVDFMHPALRGGLRS